MPQPPKKKLLTDNSELRKAIAKRDADAKQATTNRNLLNRPRRITSRTEEDIKAAKKLTAKADSAARNSEADVGNLKAQINKRTKKTPTKKRK